MKLPWSNGRAGGCGGHGFCPQSQDYDPADLELAEFYFDQQGD